MTHGHRLTNEEGDHQMEWVETTGKTIEEATDKALDQLGVADDDAEIEVLEEPRTGLFGLTRGEARLRARVRPTEVRPKQDRRRGKRSDKASRDDAAGNGDDAAATATDDDAVDDAVAADAAVGASTAGGEPRGRQSSSSQSGSARSSSSRSSSSRSSSSRDGGSRGGSERRSAEYADSDQPPVEPAVVGAAAVQFVDGLVTAFGLTADVSLTIDENELEVQAAGSDLGLLIGPGGRTLLAVQDIARVAAQRRLGDHETRLRIDVAGYRERRREALERFARSVAEQVLDIGEPRAMEPMPSADRKVIHDVLATVDGVASHSEGDDPYRRVVVTPATASSD
jgi:spoIIIJ-associated protein